MNPLGVEGSTEGVSRAALQDLGEHPGLDAALHLAAFSREEGGRLAHQALQALGQLCSLAAQLRKRTGGLELGPLPALLTRFALRGVPENEADLLSYLDFDAAFTGELVELGREDARAHRDEILELLLGED